MTHFIFLPNIIKVGKDERLFWVKSTCNDILCIVKGKLVTHLDSQFGLEQELFIIGQLDNNGHVKDFLEPSNSFFFFKMTLSLILTLYTLTDRKQRESYDPCA
jgi:hypothetical protein